ncbi:Tfp pilus assembly protein FimT/FimU [Candidatus Omnitrophota bacterium]
MCSMCRAKGFTILELIMAMAIIAVTAMVIVPKLMQSIPKNDVKQAAVELKYLLWEVQQKAITEGRIRALRFDDSVSPHRYSFHYSDNDNNMQVEGTFPTRGFEDLPDNVEFGISVDQFTKNIIYDSVPKPSVRFNEFGEPNEGGTVRLVHRSATGIAYDVAVEPISGRITVAEV